MVKIFLLFSSEKEELPFLSYLAKWLWARDQRFGSLVPVPGGPDVRVRKREIRSGWREKMWETVRQAWERHSLGGI